VKQDLQQYFGLVIAYVLPGMLGLYAVSFYVPVIGEWFGVARQQEATVGGFLFVLLASIGMGVFLQALSWAFLDRFMPRISALDLTKRTGDVELAYQDLREQHLRYSQFYANTLIALVLVFVAWYWAAPRTHVAVLVRLGLLLLVGFVLFRAAVDALERYENKRAKLLGLPKTKDAA
jgi:hypothetical protein